MIAGQDARSRSPRRSPATSSPSPRWRTCTSATRSRSRTDAPKLPPPTFPTPMFGLAVEPKDRGDEQKISSSLHKIADEDPTFKVTPRPADARTGHHRHQPAAPGRDPAPAQAALRPGGGHQGAEDPVPRDDHGRRRRPTTGTRSRPAAAASSARSTCASTRCRARSRRRRSCEEEFANKSRVREDARASTTTRTTTSRSSTTSSAARSRTSSCRPSRRGARSCWSAGRWPATACRTWRSRSTSARTTTWTARKPPSRRPAGMAFKKAFLRRPAGAAGADREAGGDGAVEVHRGDPGRPEHQAGPRREPGQPAGRPGGDHGEGAAGRGDAATPPSSAASPRGRGPTRWSFSHYDMVPANVQQQIVSQGQGRTTTRRSRTDPGERPAYAARGRRPWAFPSRSP